MEKSVLFNKDYNVNNLNNIKSHSNNETGLPSIVPLVSCVLLFPTMSVSSSTNHFNNQQPVIQDVKEKGGINMSNKNNVPAQEVRQKDLDNLEKLFNEKIKVINGHVDDKFEVLDTDIKNIKDSLEEIKENTKSKESRHFDFWSICFQAIICIIAAIIGGSIPFFFSK